MFLQPSVHAFKQAVEGPKLRKLFDLLLNEIEIPIVHLRFEKEKAGGHAVLADILHELIQIWDEAIALVGQPQEPGIRDSQ